MQKSHGWECGVNTMNKKSIISLVNITQEDISLNGKTFTPGSPVVIYRSRAMFNDGVAVSNLLKAILDSQVKVFDFDSQEVPLSEAQVTAGIIQREISQGDLAPSFSSGFYVNHIACQELLDGLKKRLDEFTWTDPGVTVSRKDVLAKATQVMVQLASGYLSDSLVALNDVTPDTDDDFLSEDRLNTFKALFQSALEE